MSDTKHARLLILGSGPAGYAAAVYAARANLNPVIITGIEQGGQLMTTTDVDNWPGDNNGVMGPELMDRMRKQADRFGAEFATGEVKATVLKERPFRLTLADGEFTADTLIVATSNNSEFNRFLAEKEAARIVDRCHICYVSHNTNYKLQKDLTIYAIGNETRTTLDREYLHQDPNLNHAV